MQSDRKNDLLISIICCYMRAVRIWLADEV